MNYCFKKNIVFYLLFALLAVGVSSENSTASNLKFVGAGKCKICHAGQYKSWQKTRMSKAFDLLLPGHSSEAKKKAGLNPSRDYSADGKCLKCHTTGYGQPGGFVSIKTTPKLAGIQCEVCHGPGRNYIKVMMKGKHYSLTLAKKAGLVVPNEKVCLNCHNADSPFFKEFNFAERVKAGVHKHFKKKHNHMGSSHHEHELEHEHKKGHDHEHEHKKGHNHEHSAGNHHHDHKD